jgi:hypothetical protein
MATLSTPNAALPYPDDNEFLKDVPDFIRVLALALDKYRVPNFTSDSNRNTKITAPVAGQLAWVTDAAPVARLQVYNGSAWVRVYPPTTQVTSGSAVPTGTAEAGSIYIQT